MAQQFLQAGRHQLQKSADSKNCAQSAGGCRWVGHWCRLRSSEDLAGWPAPSSVSLSQDLCLNAVLAPQLLN